MTGLFLRAALSQRGLPTHLFDTGPLGTGQTIASQGILHRGVKYALSAQSAAASNALAAAHETWEACLAGNAHPNLSATTQLSRTMYLWTKPGLLGTLTATAAALAMKSGVTKLPPGKYPPPFSAAPASLSLWEVRETCIEPRSLLTQLAAASTDPISPLGPNVTLRQLVQEHRPGLLLFCAGIGNEQLLAQAGHNPATYTQRRPLHMAVLHRAPQPLFAHCLQELSDKPRLTITSLPSPSQPNRFDWYIGGHIAESGNQLDEAAQRVAARDQLLACLPWMKPAPREDFSTLRIDRAEGKTANATRPDGPVLHAFPSSQHLPPHVAIWPTKLALAPALYTSLAPFLASMAANAGQPPLTHAHQPHPQHTPPIAAIPWTSTSIT